VNCFSPEETAYELPENTSDWIAVGRGTGAIFAKPGEAPTVKLAPDVARVFKDAASVNKALRKLIEAMPGQTLQKRKTA
jgi:hypothetical protein